MTTDQEESLRRQLHEEFDPVQPSRQLLERCGALIATPSTKGMHPRATESPPQQLPARRTNRRILPALAAALVIAVITGFGILLQHSASPAPAIAPATAAAKSSAATASPSRVTGTSAPATTPRTPITLAQNADRQALCSLPTSKLARFWIIYAQPNPQQYQGTVPVGRARIPALSIYTAGGPPGVGVLCVTNLATGSEDVPLRAVAAGSSRPIAYFSTDYQSIPFVAVAPGITKVTITRGSQVSVYSIDLTADLQLQDLGNSWHVVTTAGGYGYEDLTARAYNSAGTLVDTRKLTGS